MVNIQIDPRMALSVRVPTYPHMHPQWYTHIYSPLVFVHHRAVEMAIESKVQTPAWMQLPKITPMFWMQTCRTKITRLLRPKWPWTVYLQMRHAGIVWNTNHTSVTLLLENFFWGRAIPSSFWIYGGRAVFWQRFFGWGVGSVPACGKTLAIFNRNLSLRPTRLFGGYASSNFKAQLHGWKWLEKSRRFFYTSWNLKLTFSHLKMDGWNGSFLLGWPIFRCENVSFTECYGSSSLVVFVQVVAKKDGEGTL